MVRIGLPLPETIGAPLDVVHTWLLPAEPAANVGIVVRATVIAKTNWVLVCMLNSSLALLAPYYLLGRFNLELFNLIRVNLL